MSLAKKVYIDPISVFLPVKMLEQEEFALLIAILSSNPSKKYLNLLFFDSKLMFTSLKYRPWISSSQILMKIINKLSSFLIVLFEFY